MNESSTDKVLDGVRAPVDRVAARVVRKGVAYTPDKRVMTADQDHPHDLRNPLSIQRVHRWMIGYKFGRMAVLGLSFVSTNRGAMWSVRCSCGTYTLRVAKAIKNPSNGQDCCEHCRHLMFLRRAEIKRRTGRDVKWEDL